MPQIVADRFIVSGASWMDLVTGAQVRLRIARAGSIVQQIDWAAQCARLANLRHPLLNPLVDYGTLDRERTFEAYECASPLAAGGAAAERLLAHAVRFLESNGITLAASEASCAMRAIVSGPEAGGRVVGLTLQPRPALRVIADALDSPSPPGPCRMVVTGAPGAGLRTLRLSVARAARLAGYVPICGWLPDVYRWLADALAERHVCVLQLEGQGSPDVGFVAALACRSVRRHAVVSFVRDEGDPSRSVQLEPLGVRAMTRMVFIDSEQGPDPAELVNAVRRAAGSPGALVAQLDGLSCHEPRHLFRVRETAPEYTVFPAPEAPTGERRTRRLRAVLFRAATRALALAARGRHASAGRLLMRATHVLEMRGEMAEAARCAVRLGELRLARGKPGDAIAWFARALSITRDEGLRAEAAVGTGLARMAEGRLAEAEAALRGGLLAAGAASGRAAAALVRVLVLQKRHHEAMAMVQSLPPGLPRCRDLDIATAELHLAAGDVPAAVRVSLTAIADARAATDVAAVARAEQVCALALAAAGDRAAAVEHARAGLAAARCAHVPLEAARLREVLRELDSTLTPPARPGNIESSAALEALLDLAHAAADEREAVHRVCDDLRTRLRAAAIVIVSNGSQPRVLATAGRPWCGEPIVAQRAIAARAAVAPGGREPAESAEPIRLGGDVIAALAVRWAAGTAIATSHAVSVLRAGAVAIAPFVNALLEVPLPPAPRGANELLGDSAAAGVLRTAIGCAARAPFAVLIEGESGSGKELVARRIHALGPRRERRFCALNCAALTDDLVEAELFGHTRGAFTGAVGERAGLFEEADGGTLFLDEVGELSPRAQAKLLRVLQDGEVRRVGENVARHVDVRVIAATNRSLEREAAAGRFRADLRFRLDVIRIAVPPLRERATDIPLLASHFWAAAAARVGSRATLSPDALAALARYEWPGNVRELQNAVAWIAVHSPRRGRIGATALPAHVAQAGVAPAAPFLAAREAFERRYIRAALAGADGQRTRAAEALGLTRQGLAKMMKRLGIEG